MVWMSSHLRSRLRLRHPVTSDLKIAAVDDAPLSPSVVRRGLRLSIIEGALSNVHITISAGAFLTGFALLLGANAFELGILGALPFLSQLFGFAGAYLEERLGERRRLASLSALIGRGLWLPMLALPFLPAIGRIQLPMFLLIMALSQ